MPGDRHQAFLMAMFVLAMASLHSYHKPAAFFNHVDSLINSHVLIPEPALNKTQAATLYLSPGVSAGCPFGERPPLILWEMSPKQLDNGNTLVLPLEYLTKEGRAMRKSAKFAVSLPWEDFKELEAIRRKAGLSRSGFLLGTFRAWKEARERERLVRDYENGYRRKPEGVSIAKAMAATSAESLPEEDWT
jgi:hypothetical protein